MIYLIGFIFCVMRLFIKPRLENIPTFELSYEAFAHIYVGFLIGAWFDRKRWTKYNSRDYLTVAVGISLFELGVFIYQKWII